MRCSTWYVATGDPHFSRRFYRAALDREALVRPIGNTVYLMPPYVLAPDECEILAEGLAATLGAVLG